MQARNLQWMLWTALFIVILQLNNTTATMPGRVKDDDYTLAINMEHAAELTTTTKWHLNEFILVNTKACFTLEVQASMSDNAK